MREEHDCFVENAISVYAVAGIDGKRRINRTVCLSGEQGSPNVTGAARPEEVPQVKAELERIWSDYEFVCSGPSWEAVTERTAQYKKLDVLA